MCLVGNPCGIADIVQDQSEGEVGLVSAGDAWAVGFGSLGSRLYVGASSRSIRLPGVPGRLISQLQS